MPLAPLDGSDLSRMAEQLGATPDDPGPVREVHDTLWRWRAAGYFASPGADDWTHAPFYEGRAAMVFSTSSNPSWAFAQPEFATTAPFRWGIVPRPSPRREDAPIPYWRRRCPYIRAQAPDPDQAFAVLTTIVCADRPSTAH